MKVVFVHPDLGIGGAERLVVDAAVGLKSRGHAIKIFTSHHDPEHCFSETADGTLPVYVYGDWIPRHLFGRMFVLFAIIRMFYVAAVLLVRTYLTGWKDKNDTSSVWQEVSSPDVIFCDQVSAVVPFLRLTGAKILFYCHFPDQLLSKRSSRLKRLYRLPFDVLEEQTTGMADRVLVNSEFTKSVFYSTFKTLSAVPVTVLYPGINLSRYDSLAKADQTASQPGDAGGGSSVDSKVMFLSINRFERKKNIGLALDALAELRERHANEALSSKVQLVIAGGYDQRVTENVEYLEELRKRAQELKLPSHLVDFRKSPSDSERALLLAECRGVVYTPANEHFGIVPLEAMYASKPVIAANSGGPLESVVDQRTGFLCDPTPSAFSQALYVLASNQSVAAEMGSRGREHVRNKFSLEAFTNHLEGIIQKLCPS
mmetsp:Transcript_38327/g.62087  ORF Transcript_38327/g.62087 Transcript_38327/m.62087 type:complete len:429 (+) Transcript_38327:183-1469(+)